jgi:site-specific recombinase XerD
MDHDYPTTVDKIETRHIEEWIGSILERNRPATAHNRFRGLQRFMNWYATKDDDFLSPMRKLRPTRLPRLMPQILIFDDLRAILATRSGKDFEDRRDDALIRILFDTGARRHEIAALRYSPPIRPTATWICAARWFGCPARAARTPSSP